MYRVPSPNILEIPTAGMLDMMMQMHSLSQLPSENPERLGSTPKFQDAVAEEIRSHQEYASQFLELHSKCIENVTSFTFFSSEEKEEQYLMYLHFATYPVKTQIFQSVCSKHPFPQKIITAFFFSDISPLYSLMNRMVLQPYSHLIAVIPTLQLRNGLEELTPREKIIAKQGCEHESWCLVVQQELIFSFQSLFSPLKPSWCFDQKFLYLVLCSHLQNMCLLHSIIAM